ncbi:ABC transporter family substrate-binding protein, partial [Rhodococcus sp. HM1]|nr:ABC transporter family substrate-binding protein [Rhodococcus sp. HM1]
APADEPSPETEVVEEDAVIAQLEAPSNLSSVCDPSLTADLDAAIRGNGDVHEILTNAQPKLWDLAVNLPIVQDRTVVAAGPGIDGVSLAGAVPAGVVADAPNWWRTTP